MQPLIIIGGLVVVGLICLGLYHFVTNVRIGPSNDADRNPTDKE